MEKKNLDLNKLFIKTIEVNYDHVIVNKKNKFMGDFGAFSKAVESQVNPSGNMSYYITHSQIGSKF